MQWSVDSPPTVGPTDKETPTGTNIMDDGDMDVDMEGGMGEETGSRQASATSRTLSRQSNRPGELHIIDEGHQ